MHQAAAPTAPRNGADRAGLTPSLELRGIARSFGERTLFRDVDLHIDGPALVGLTGRNGSGKTSLLRIVAQLLAPTRGEVRICGLPARGDAPAARARVAFVAHDAAARRSRSVRANLQLEGRLRGLGRAAARDRAQLLAARWGLEQLLDEPVRSLSRGQLQRVSFALADVVECPLVLLDEPTVALDEAGRDVLTAALERWRAQRIVLVASHEREWLEATCELVVELGDAS